MSMTQSGLEQSDAGLETRVTGRRIVQYIIDAIIVSVVGSVLSWALDRGSGGTHAILAVVLIVADVAWWFFYWAVQPHVSGGRTLGMRMLGLRIISKTDSGPAGLGQLTGRALLLIIDTLFAGLVGWITMLCSKQRQRIGDHAARTLVVRAHPVAAPGHREFAGAGQAGSAV